MKQILLLIILCFTLFSCQTKTGIQQDPDTAAQLNYPFAAKHALKWQPGDEKNALIALDCLKNYVAGDMKGAVLNFADTATFISDDFYLRVRRIAWQQYWARYAAIWPTFPKVLTGG